MLVCPAGAPEGAGAVPRFARPITRGDVPVEPVVDALPPPMPWVEAPAVLLAVAPVLCVAAAEAAPLEFELRLIPAGSGAAL